MVSNNQLLQLFSQNQQSPLGNSAPPAVFGAVPAPLVTGLQVTKRTAGTWFVQFSLTFEEPLNVGVSHYNVYARRVANKNESRALVASAQGSPVEFLLIADQAADLSFTVTTVMKAGYESPVEGSPTVGASIAASEVPGAANSITSKMISSLVADKITTGTLTSVTITASTLTLNLSNFTTTIDNTAAGLGTMGFKIQSNSGGQNGVIGGTSDPAVFIALYGDSAQTKLSASLAQSVNGSDRSGTLRLADGSGTGALGSGQRIIATGSDGKVQMGTFEVDRTNASVDPNFKSLSTSGATAGAATLPTNPVGFLKVLIDATAARIPYYAA